MARYALQAIGVHDTLTNKKITPQNETDWIAYQQWLAEGNTPDIYVPPNDSPPSTEELAARTELLARETIIEQLRQDSSIQALRKYTPAQVDNWINTNVTDLTSAKTVLRILARVVAILARESIKD